MEMRPLPVDIVDDTPTDARGTTRHLAMRSCRQERETQLWGASALCARQLISDAWEVCVHMANLETMGSFAGTVVLASK